MGTRSWSWLWLAVPAVLAACEDEPTDQADGDADSDADSDLEIAPPAPPAPPVFTPCPLGWREVTDPESDLVTCDPWPEGGPHECAEDEAHFPGEPGCSRIGTACPVGDWAEDLPADREVLYVRAGAPAGGTGTREAPLGSIAEAMDAAREGTIIALSKGMFDEAVRLRTGVTLWGACVAETVLACSTSSSDRGTVSVGGSETVVRNLQIGGNRPGVTVVGGSTFSVRLEEVRVSNARVRGVAVSGGTAELNDIIVSDTHGADDETMGFGLEVNGGARVDVQRADFTGNYDVGILVGLPDTVVTLTDVVVRGTEIRGDGRGGEGLHVEDGPRVEVNRSVFERNQRFGLSIGGEGTILLVNDVIIRDTGFRGNGMYAIGLEMGNGSEAVLNRAVLERNLYAGITAGDPGTRLELNDIIVRETLSRRDGLGGRGLEVQTAMLAEVHRAVFERNREIGVIAGDPDTELLMFDVQVRETFERECARDTCGEYPGGAGVVSIAGAHVEIERFLIDFNASCGIQMAFGMFLNEEGIWVDFATGGTMDLHEGEVSNNPIGANVQTEGFDINRLMDRVVFRDNERDLDMTELPVPEMGNPLGDADEP
jgi:hypothetical protein